MLIHNNAYYALLCYLSHSQARGMAAFSQRSYSSRSRIRDDSFGELSFFRQFQEQK